MNSIQEEHAIVNRKRMELKNANFHLLAAEETLIIAQVLKTRTAVDGNWKGKEEEILTETKRRVRTVRNIIMNYYASGWQDILSVIGIADYMHAYVEEYPGTGSQSAPTPSAAGSERRLSSDAEVASAKRLIFSVEFEMAVFVKQEEYEKKVNAL